VYIGLHTWVIQLTVRICFNKRTRHFSLWIFTGYQMRCGWLKGNAPTVRSSKHILSHTPTRHSTGSISFNLKIVFREASDDENIISLTRVSENRPVAIYYRSFAPMYLYAATALSRPSSSTLLFTLLLVYLALLWLPHHSPHYRFHHLSLPGPFTPDLKLICFTNKILPSIVFLVTFWPYSSWIRLQPELVGTGVCLF